MSKSRKKSSNKPRPAKTQKKPVKKRNVIITLAIVAVIAAGIIIASITFSNTPKAKLANTSWTPLSAHNASGDEVEIAEVYDVSYSNYTGSLTFNDDGSFSFWMSPGTPDDGTHTGTYEFTDNSTIKACFDEGTEMNFDVIYEDNKISLIEVNYNGYLVTFTSTDNL